MPRDRGAAVDPRNDTDTASNAEMDWTSTGCIVHASSRTGSDQQGALHLEIVRATNQMQSAKFGEMPTHGQARLNVQTAFGREVGGDEIAWWVNRSAADLEQFTAATAKALDALQRLMQDSRTLRREYEATTYEQLIEDLRRFCDEHREDIEIFAAFVEWLGHRHPMAPSILFTYRVWGNTRIGDRSFATPDGVAETDDVLLKSAEYPLGLRGRLMLTAREVELEISAAIADSVDPEYGAGAGIIQYDLIRQRVALEVLTRFVTYFEQLRDSCREILGEANKQAVLESLLDDEGFWCALIADVIARDPIETQWWDLKETLEMWHAKGDARQDAETHFVERAAAFANAEGGVFLIGVSDKPRLMKGVSDAENKIKHLMSVFDARTNLPSSSIRVAAVRCADPAGALVTCVVVAVARTPLPVYVSDKQNRFTYPVRRGPGLERRADGPLREIKSKQPQVQDWEFLRHLTAAERSFTPPADTA